MFFSLHFKHIYKLQQAHMGAKVGLLDLNYIILCKNNYMRFKYFLGRTLASIYFMFLVPCYLFILFILNVRMYAMFCVLFYVSLSRELLKLMLFC